MDYLKKKFSSRPASKAYLDGWEATFGKKRPAPAPTRVVHHGPCDSHPAETDGDALLAEIIDGPLRGKP